MKAKTYSGYDQLPDARTTGPVLPGCMILEGGAWRCLYTQGVLDGLMEADINMQTTIGVSAGAMSALAYVTGQIGLSARVNLGHRHDTNYCGLGAIRRDRSLTGFSYFFETLLPEQRLDWDALYSKDRALYISVTNCETGKTEYLNRDETDICKAVQASATLPYISHPISLNGKLYLDGGCSERVPYPWAKAQGFEKIIVIRTRDRSFRKEEKENSALNHLFYHKYPELMRSLMRSAAKYNQEIADLEAAEAAGELFMIAPSEPLTVSRFEGDMEKLGGIYKLGYKDAKTALPELRAYLAK